MTIPARYKNGIFKPLRGVSVKEGTIVEVYVPEASPIARPQSIGELPFAGMWQDREDYG